MRAERVKPVDQTSEATRKGPQLVPPRKAQTEVRMEAAIRDPHPLVTVLIVGVIALIGAGVFVGTLVTAVLVRNTGVNWMFQQF